MDTEVQTTLRDTLNEKFAEAAEEVKEVETTETAAETEARERDEKGRFVPKEAKTEQAPEEQIVPQEPAIQRPSSWKKEMWPVWDKLTTGASLTPEEARQLAQYNAQREQQFAGGVSTYKQEAERAKPILEVMAPFQADIERSGLPAPQILHSLMVANRTLAYGSPHEKLQLFSKLANDYGIPVAALYDQNVQQQYLSQPHQQYQPAQRQPDINQIVEQALAERETKQTIASMESNKEKYPFFQYVRNTMAQLLETGAATDLESAYELSLGSPEHSMLTQVMQQQQAQADEQRRIAEKQEAARKARANVVSTKSATPANAGTTNSKPSVRAALEESVAAHLGGARV